MSNELTLASMNHYVVEILPSNTPSTEKLTVEQDIRRLLGVPYLGAQPACIHFHPTRKSPNEVGIAYVWEIPHEINALRTERTDDPFMQEARALLKTFVENNGGAKKSYSFMILHSLDETGQVVGPRGVSYPFEVEQPSLPSGAARSLKAPSPGLGSDRSGN